MKQLHILLFFISTVFSITAYSQQTLDTIKVKENYGLRVGVDISKPINSFNVNNNKGLEIVADFRVSSNYYVAAELGYLDKTTDEDYLNFSTKGSYIKVGFNYNAYKNWVGMTNEIYIGLRYGFSFFDETLNTYTPNANGTYFIGNQVKPGTEFTELTAHWAEFVIGLKVETFKNLYLGASLSLNKLLSTNDPENFKNLHIPGYNRVFLNNTGVGFNYTISYLIPIFKKTK